MPDMLFTVEPAGAAPKRAKRKILAIRGRRRKHVKTLMRLLRQVRNDDVREQLRGEKLDYPPYLFRHGAGTPVASAISMLIQRCEVALADKI